MSNRIMIIPANIEVWSSALLEKITFNRQVKVVVIDSGDEVSDVSMVDVDGDGNINNHRMNGTLLVDNKYLKDDNQPNK